jgi:hypothetical protein
MAEKDFWHGHHAAGRTMRGIACLCPQKVAAIAEHGALHADVFVEPTARSLIKHDVSQEIPKEATIQSAVMPALGR